MKEKSYQRTDVAIFRNIINHKIFAGSCNYSARNLNKLVKHFYKSEILYDEFDNNIKNTISTINIAEFGYKDNSDLKLEYTHDVFNNKKKIILTPTCSYSLEDKINIPNPRNEENKFYLKFMGDTYERLKVKAENVINETSEEKHIELYAKKNLQILKSIFYDSKCKIQKVCIKNSWKDFYKYFILNTFIYNAILYYQKTFSVFYTGQILTKETLKLELMDAIGLNSLIECTVSKSNHKSKCIKNHDPIIPTMIWNGQVNSLITLFYDLMNYRHDNNDVLLETTEKAITDLLNRYITDRNGNHINKNTIRVCLQEYREDKRSKGNKRIDISKYIDPEE